MSSGTGFQVIMTSPRLAEPAVAVLEQAGCTIHFMAPYPSAQAVAALTGEVQAHAILTRQGPVTAAAMDATARLRIVARHGVGVDDVDLDAARARGIIVARAPGSNTLAVAEHTIAMILAMAKDVRCLGEMIATGNWRGGATKVRDSHGMRLGLLGFGAIGRQVAMLAQPFGMDVMALARPGTAIRPAGRVAQAPNLDTGHIAGAALDVFEVDPPPPDYGLSRHASVLATPHVSGVTDGSLVNMGLMTAEYIAAFLTGQTRPAERVVVG